MGLPNFLTSDGDGYQQQMGRWSRRLAVPFADFGGHRAGERILDLGSGTGSLMSEIGQRERTTRLVGLDYSETYTRYANEHSEGEAQFLVGDAAALPFADNAFDRSLSLLVLHFMSDPEQVIRELSRVTRPGGVIAAAVWDAAGGVVVNRLFCDTAAAIDPRGEAFRQKSFSRPLTGDGELEAAWRSADLSAVESTTLTIRMDFENFEDYWAPYIGKDGPYAPFVSTLDSAARQTLTEAVRQAYLSGGADGPRSFAASAWAVRGRVPVDDHPTGPMAAAR